MNELRERLDDLDAYFEALIGDGEFGALIDVGGAKGARKILDEVAALLAAAQEREPPGVYEIERFNREVADALGLCPPEPAEPVRKPDGYAHPHARQIIAEGWGSVSVHAAPPTPEWPPVYIATPPAAPEQLGVARDIRDTAAKLLARAGAREDDDARFMVRMALACDRHAADLGYYTPAAPVQDGALDVSRLDDDALIDMAQRVEHECTRCGPHSRTPRGRQTPEVKHD
jgi:hypothetical protein